jgi:hypothetical protein
MVASPLLCVGLKYQISVTIPMCLLKGKAAPLLACRVVI